jgi:hypothetical protein
MIIKYKFMKDQIGFSRDNTRKFYYIDLPKDASEDGDFWKGVALALSVAGVEVEAFEETE